MSLYITSYGQRRGPLDPAPTLSFDVRSLPNPPKSWRTTDARMIHWLFSNQVVCQRFNEIERAIQERVNQAEIDGEPELRVGVYCELGRHRSFSIVEELGKGKFSQWHVVVNHRDAQRAKESQIS